MNVADKVAVIAGGASGLGQATCEELAEHGARIAVLDRDEAAARAVADGIDGAVALACDVTDAGSVEQAIGHVREHFGAIHINVNTAGIADAAKLVSKGRPAPLEGFERVIGVNLVGTFNVMRVAVAAMLDNEPEDGERGVVVNTSSGAAYDGQIGQAAYSASKAGVIGMSLPIARELGGLGVRVNAIAPGLFETPMAAGLPDNVRAGLIEMMTGPERLGRPREFAALARHAIENGYLNAAALRLDAAARMNAK